MIDCSNVRMRESLPEYMHGLLDLRERLVVQAHLAGCGACTAELAVLERCRTVMSNVPAVDTGRIVAALPSPPASGRQATSAARPTATTLELPLTPRRLATGRLAEKRGPGLPGEQPGRRQHGWLHTAWRVAAVALLVVGSLSVIVGQRGHWAVVDGMLGARPTNDASSVNGGDDSGPRPSDSAMLAAAAGRSGNPRFGSTLSLAGGLSDLSDAALAALLGEVDAVEALPLVEPPPVNAFVVADQSGAL
jgi:hypothetical protein